MEEIKIARIPGKVENARIFPVSLQSGTSQKQNIRTGKNFHSSFTKNSCYHSQNPTKTPFQEPRNDNSELSGFDSDDVQFASTIPSLSSPSTTVASPASTRIQGRDARNRRELCYPANLRKSQDPVILRLLFGAGFSQRQTYMLVRVCGYHQLRNCGNKLVLCDFSGKIVFMVLCVEIFFWTLG